MAHVCRGGLAFTGVADCVSPRQNAAELCCVCEHLVLLFPLLGELGKIKLAGGERVAGSLPRDA